MVVLCNLGAVHGSILGVIAPALFDWAAAIAENPEPQTPNPEPAASIVRSVLFLPGASNHRLQATSWLIDAAGRKVLGLRPGANDVRELPPGVYFAAEDGTPSALRARKVVVAR